MPNKHWKARSEELSKFYKTQRTESNIMMVRRRAIWGNRDPDLAERQYRDAIERNKSREESSRR
jgi:hypothetical protein